MLTLVALGQSNSSYLSLQLEKLPYVKLELEALYATIPCKLHPATDNSESQGSSP